MVFVFATLGTLAADTFWFIVGRFFPKKMIPSFVKRTVFDSAYSFFKTCTKDRFFLSLLFLKFFIGVRLAIILYTAQQKISFPRFVIYDILGTIIYMVLITGLSFGFGKAIQKVLPSYHITVSVLVGVLLVFFVSHMAREVYKTLSKNR